MVLNLIFIGPPGAGKGTVAQAIMQENNLIQVSTGDLIRNEVMSGSNLGKTLAEIINKGNLVEDNLIAEIFEKYLKKEVNKEEFNGFILDGFPRTLPQADMLKEILERLNQNLTAVIYIESSKENVVNRLSSRWTCEKCKKVYNTVSLKPKVQGICDIDGANLIQRDDDKPETISKRYDTFLEKTSPLIDYYQKTGILYKYDGNVPPNESIDQAKKIINKIKNN
jgi:adenylate kinase